jgi:probable phosphoglycerate mutase
VATFFLVRHGSHALLGKVLVGRQVDIALDERGHEQALWLAKRFGGACLSAVQSSPRKRALETARPIAQSNDLPTDIEQALDEIDCGAWSGRSFEELRDDPRWQQWNSARSSMRPPAGESMQEAQQRMVDHIEHTHAQAPGARIAMVSHGDVIRAAVLHYLQQPIDAYHSFEIDPGSVTTLVIDDDGPRVVALNEAAAP